MTGPASAALLLLLALLGAASGFAVTGLVATPLRLGERVAIATVAAFALDAIVCFLLSLGLGLGPASILLAPALVTAVAVLLARALRVSIVDTWRLTWDEARGQLGTTVSLAAIAAVALVVFALLFSRAMFQDAGGDLVTGYWIPDWAQHLITASSFSTAQNLPPQNPIMSGTPLYYPFLPDFTSGMLMRLGLGDGPALWLPQVILAVALVLLVVSLAERLGARRSAGVLAVIDLLPGRRARLRRRPARRLHRRGVPLRPVQRWLRGHPPGGRRRHHRAHHRRSARPGRGPAHQLRRHDLRAELGHPGVLGPGVVHATLRLVAAPAHPDGGLRRGGGGPGAAPRRLRTGSGAALRRRRGGPPGRPPAGHPCAEPLRGRRHRRRPGGDPLAPGLAALRRGGGGGRRSAPDPARARAPWLRRPRQPVPVAGAGMDVRSDRAPPPSGTRSPPPALAAAVGDTLTLPFNARFWGFWLVNLGVAVPLSLAVLLLAIGRLFRDRSIGRAAGRVLGIVPPATVRFLLACHPRLRALQRRRAAELGLGQHQAAGLLVPRRRPGGGRDHRPPLGGRLAAHPRRAPGRQRAGHRQPGAAPAPALHARRRPR